MAAEGVSRLKEYIDLVLLYLLFLGPVGLTTFESRIALNPRLGGVKDFAFAIIKYRVCYFRALDAVLPKDPLICLISMANFTRSSSDGQKFALLLINLCLQSLQA